MLHKPPTFTPPPLFASLYVDGEPARHGFFQKSCSREFEMKVVLTIMQAYFRAQGSHGNFWNYSELFIHRGKG